MSDGWELTIESKESLEAFAQLVGEQGHLMCLLLESVGWDTISHLRSHIALTRPPVKKGESVRPAHPGGWADITTDLVGAYRFEIHAGGRKVRWTQSGGGAAQPMYLAGVMPQKANPPYELRFYNDMEYAAALEALDGYFVLAGVTEPGGPVERAIKAAIAARPDWKLV